MTPNEELAERKQIQDSLGEQATTFLRGVQDEFTQQEAVIGELREQLTKLNGELTEKDELLLAYEEDEKRWKEEKKDLQEKLDEARRSRDRFKDDAKDSRSNIKEFEALIDEYERVLEGILTTALSMLSQHKAADHSVADTPTEVVPTITGVFVCKGDDMQEQNQHKLEKLKTLFPRVNFTEPIFIRDHSPDRPPIPEVDLVILFSRGMPHTDADAVRNVVRKTRSNLISGLSVPSIALKVAMWMQNLEATAASRT